MACSCSALSSANVWGGNPCTDTGLCGCRTRELSSDGEGKSETPDQDGAAASADVLLACPTVLIVSEERSPLADGRGCSL